MMTTKMMAPLKTKDSDVHKLIGNFRHVGTLVGFETFVVVSKIVHCFETFAGYILFTWVKLILEHQNEI